MRIPIVFLLLMIVAPAAAQAPLWDLSVAAGGEGMAGLTLRNHGDSVETYDLSVHEMSGWPVGRGPAPRIEHVLTPSALTLGPGESEMIEVRVRLPEDALGGHWRLLVAVAPRSVGAEPFVLGEIAVSPVEAVAGSSATPSAVGVPTAALVTAGIAGAALVGIAFARRETWRWAAWGLFVPLYTRLARSDVLSQPTRERVYALVRSEPGVHFGLLAQRAGLGSGALAHHLRVLERHSLVRGRREGRLRRFYPAGEMPVVSDLTPHQARILGVIGAGGPTQGEIAAALGVTQQGASHHLRALERKGRLELRFVAGAWRYYPVAEGRPGDVSGARVEA